MKHYALCFMFLGTAFLSGCAYSVHENHTSDFTNNTALSKSQVIEATAEQDVVLGFVGQTDYVDQAFTQLKTECPQGDITGIQTRYSTSLGFFSWTNKIVMKAYCVP